MKSKKFNRILIANRGEIALRAIRACRELGLQVGVVYSRADANSLPVKMADEGHFIESDSDLGAYLDQQKLVDIAVIHKFDAIYPGYGFLAENADFAALCALNDIAFIGPSSEALEHLGDKLVSKKYAASSGLPFIPGSQIVNKLKDVEQATRKIGLPVVVKAAGGGGGKGIRVVTEMKFLAKSFRSAQKEARQAFDSADMYVEKYIRRPRHIEIQVLADQYGHAVSLGERECSIQRRHQKLLEEAPSSFLTQAIRRKLGSMATRLIKNVGLVGIATVEFLLDQDRNIYFIEVNPRIQVEHGVTEAITGIDLVKWQFRLAQGDKLTIKQQDVRLNGYALECRINAEDPLNDFQPADGIIEQYLPPGGPGIRICSSVFVGQRVSSQFDSLLTKVIAWGQDRQEAVSRMQRALEELVLIGVPTTLPFHLALLKNKKFQQGDIHTRFLEEQKIQRATRSLVESRKQVNLYNDHTDSLHYKEIATIAASVYKNLQCEMAQERNQSTDAWSVAAKSGK